MEFYLKYLAYKSICFKNKRDPMSFQQYIIFAEQMRLTNLGY